MLCVVECGWCFGYNGEGNHEVVVCIWYVYWTYSEMVVDLLLGIRCGILIDWMCFVENLGSFVCWEEIMKNGEKNWWWKREQDKSW